MRICIITPYYYPIKGGITSYVSHLVKELEEDKDISVDVIARLGAEQEGVTAIHTNKIFFIAKTYIQIHKKRYDIIHSHAHWYTLAPGVLYNFLNPKTRVVHTFHTELLKEMKGLKKKLFEWLLSKCNIVTFVSIFLMKKTEKNLKITTEKKVIYAGASKNNFDEKEIKKFKDRYKSGDSAPIISFVGSLVWEKKVEGVKMLIKAFKAVIKEYPNAKLLIIGDGEYREDVERLVKELNIKNNVVFTGFLEDVFVPLSITDIYTHISHQEGGVSISLLEAMSMGKPVIATRVGGIPELIIDRENGILVESDPGLIANAITELYSDNKKMKELGENARKTVEEGYTWELISEKFMEIYEEAQV